MLLINAKKIILLFIFCFNQLIYAKEDKAPNVECLFAYSITKSKECYDWYQNANPKDIETLKTKSALFKRCIVSNCGDYFFDENDPIQKRNSYQYKFIEKKGCEELTNLELKSSDIVPNYFFKAMSHSLGENISPAKDASGDSVKTQTNVPYKMTRLFCPSQEVEECTKQEMALQYPVMCFKNAVATSDSLKALLKQCIFEHRQEACNNPDVINVTKNNLKKTIAWVYCDEDRDGDLYPESLSSSLLSDLNSSGISCDPNIKCPKNKICSMTATCAQTGIIHKEDLTSQSCTDLTRDFDDVTVNMKCNGYSDKRRDDPNCVRINSLEEGRDTNSTRTIHIKSQGSGKLDDYVEYISYRKYPDLQYGADHNYTEAEIAAADWTTKEVFLAYFNPYDYKEVKKGPSFIGALVAFVATAVVVVGTGGTALVAAGYALAAGGIVAVGTLVAVPPGTYDDKTYIIDPGIMDRTVALNFTIDREEKHQNVTYKEWSKSGWFTKKTTKVYMGAQYNSILVHNLNTMGTLHQNWYTTSNWDWNGRTPNRIDYAFDLNFSVAPRDAEVIGVYNINNDDTEAEFPETQIKSLESGADCNSPEVSGTIITDYHPLTPYVPSTHLPKKSITSMGLIIPFNGCYTFKFYNTDLRPEMESEEKNFGVDFNQANLTRTQDGNKYNLTCENLWITQTDNNPEFRDTNDSGTFTQVYPIASHDATHGRWNLRCDPGYKFRYCDAVYNGQCMLKAGFTYISGSKTVDEPQDDQTAPIVLSKDAQNHWVKGARDLTKHPDYDSSSYASPTIEPIHMDCSCKAQRSVMKGNPANTTPLFTRTKCFYPGDTYPMTLKMIDSNDTFQTYDDIFPSVAQANADAFTQDQVNSANSLITNYTNSLINGIEKTNSMKFINNYFSDLVSHKSNTLSNDYSYPIDIDHKSTYSNYDITTEGAVDFLVALRAYTDAQLHMSDFILHQQDMPDDYPGWGCGGATASGVTPPAHTTNPQKLANYHTTLKQLLEEQGCNLDTYSGASIESGDNQCQYKRFALKTAMCNLFNHSSVISYENTIKSELNSIIDTRYNKVDSLSTTVYTDYQNMLSVVNSYILPNRTPYTAQSSQGSWSGLLFKSDCGEYNPAKASLNSNYLSSLDIFTKMKFSSEATAILNGLTGVVQNNLDNVTLSYSYDSYKKTGTTDWDSLSPKIVGTYSCNYMSDCWYDDDNNVSTPNIFGPGCPATQTGSCEVDGNYTGTHCTGTCSGYIPSHWGSNYPDNPDESDDWNQNCTGTYDWYKSTDSSNNGGIETINNPVNTNNISKKFSSFGNYECDKLTMITNGDENSVCTSIAGKHNGTHHYNYPAYLSPETNGTIWTSTALKIKPSTTRAQIINTYEKKWMHENRFTNGFGDYNHSKNYQNIELKLRTKNQSIKTEANNLIYTNVNSYVTDVITKMYQSFNDALVRSDIDSNITNKVENDVQSQLVSQYPQNLVEGSFAPFNMVKIIDIMDDSHRVDKTISTPGGLKIIQPNDFYISIAPMSEVRQYRCYKDWDQCGFASDGNCTLDLDHEPNPKYTLRVSDFEGKSIPVLKDEYYTCKNEVDIPTCDKFDYSSSCHAFNLDNIDDVDYDNQDFGDSFKKNIGEAVALNEMPAIFGAESLTCESGLFWDFSWLSDPMFYLSALTGISLDMFASGNDVGDSIQAWAQNTVVDDYTTAECSEIWSSKMIEAGCGPLDMATQILSDQGISAQNPGGNLCDSNELSKSITAEIRYTMAQCRDFANPLGYNNDEMQKDSINKSLEDTLGPFKPVIQGGVTIATWTEYIGWPLGSLATQAVLKLLYDTFLDCNQCTNLECAKKFKPESAEKVYKLTNGKSELTHYKGDEFGFGVEPNSFDMYGNCFLYNKGCAKKILGKCMRQKYEHCCYGTRLATVLVGQIYKQQGWTFEADGCDKVKLDTLSDISFEPCPPNTTPSPALKCINYKAFQDYIVNRIDWTTTKTIDPSEILDGYLDAVRMEE